MRCDVCGSAYDPQDHFCRNCGAAVNTPPATRAGTDTPASPTAAHRGKTKRRLRSAAAAIVIVALAIVIAAQMLPDLISLSLGGKPKDLGVVYTEADYQSILGKTQIEADAPPASENRRDFTDQYTGTKDIDWTLTDSEVTAWFNMDQQPGYWPFEQVQFKSHADNVIEVSLAINPVKLMTFECITQSLPQEIQSFMNGLTESIPVYAKARIAFTGPKQVQVKMLGFEAAGLPVSGFGTSDEANRLLESLLNGAFSSIEPVNIESYSTVEGSLHIKGTWYGEIKRVPVKEK